MLSGQTEILPVFCQGGNFCTKPWAVVKNTARGKIEKLSKPVEIIMSTPLHRPIHRRLWKRVVEKVVENVEKCEFSTGIPAVCTEPAAVENPA